MAHFCSLGIPYVWPRSQVAQTPKTHHSSESPLWVAYLHIEIFEDLAELAIYLAIPLTFYESVKNDRLNGLSKSGITLSSGTT